MANILTLTVLVLSSYIYIIQVRAGIQCFEQECSDYLPCTHPDNGKVVYCEGEDAVCTSIQIKDRLTLWKRACDTISGVPWFARDRLNSDGLVCLDNFVFTDICWCKNMDLCNTQFQLPTRPRPPPPPPTPVPPPPEFKIQCIYQVCDKTELEGNWECDYPDEGTVIQCPVDYICYEQADGASMTLVKRGCIGNVLLRTKSKRNLELYGEACEVNALGENICLCSTPYCNVKFDLPTNAGVKIRDGFTCFENRCRDGVECDYPIVGLEMQCRKEDICVETQINGELYYRGCFVASIGSALTQGEREILNRDGIYCRGGTDNYFPGPLHSGCFCKSSLCNGMYKLPEDFVATNDFINT